MNAQNYSIWIEAEEWSASEWTPRDDNTDVTVTFDDGARWVATFFSYQNILSLAEKNRQTGECLGGKYFVGTDTILADEVSRQRIEEVIADLIRCGDFEKYFALCESVADNAAQIVGREAR
jgi:hypothetical protein